MKKLTTLMTALLLTCSAQAQQVTLENARTEAASFFRSRGMSIAGGVKLSARAARRAQGTTAGTSTDAAYYIFNGANNKGFVVISGDSRTEPVLGYSTTDTYDAASIPPNMQAFLDRYAAQIARMDASSAAAISRVKKHTAIEPLMPFKWNQGSPYNDLCPPDNGTKSYTGCEATALAQIMAYKHYPRTSTTSIPAYTTESKKISLPELPPVTFNWDAMPVSGDKDQAVATLMRYVGQGELMDYTSMESGTTIGPAVYALKYYFGYDKNVRCLSRSSYTISEWDSLVYASLAENNPVLYTGATASLSGHAFVCDGYDGDGLFHINWGWGGMYNSYFRLAVLNPHGTGIGGGGDNSAYNMAEEVITGIQPPTGKAEEPELIDCDGIQSNNTILEAIYTNHLMDNQDITYQSGWGQYGSDGTISAVITEEPFKLKCSTDTSFTSDLTKAHLAAGTYKLFPIIRIPDVTDWKHTYASNEYIQVDVDVTGQIKTTDFPIIDLTLDSIQFVTPKMLPYQAHVFAHVTNKGAEVDNAFFLFASKTSDWGKSVDHTGGYIEANSKDSLEYYFKPQETGLYHLALASDDQCANIIGTQDVTFGEAILQKYTMEMVSFSQLSDTTVNMVIRNTSTMDYNKSVALVFYKYNSDGVRNNIKDISLTKEIAAGQTQSFTLTVPRIESGMKYQYAIFYKVYSDPLMNDEMPIRYDFPESTGISSTPASGGSTAQPYFSLEGMKMQNATQKGIYIHNGQKVIR
jgi:hypothetical protein